MESCSSAGCCWCWATKQLLDEFASLREVTDGLRAILDEELGDSAQLQLLQLRAEHEEQAKLLLSLEQEVLNAAERNSRLERAERNAVEEAREARIELVELREKSSEELHLAAVRELQLQEQLKQALQRPQAEVLETWLEEEKQRSALLETENYKFLAQMETLKIERTELEWQNKQLRMAKLAKKKPKAAAHKLPKRPLASPARRDAGSRLRP